MDGIYFDSSLSFSFKHGLVVFQRLRDAVRYIIYYVTNFIDNIIGFATTTKATESFKFLHKLLLDLDFKISEKKWFLLTLNNMSRG